MNLIELGQRIRQQREKCGLKQNDLASALQISPQAVSKWERGENAPDISTLVPLSRLLGVSVEWILGAHAQARDVFEATVLASGVQTTRQTAETMRPREFAAWTNSICYLLTEAVLRHDGVPVNYVGPGIVSFFAGADHRRRAIAAATSAYRTAGVPLKIGLATGPIYFGPIGHPDYARPDIIGEAFVIAFLSRDWAAANTTSGLVACTSSTEGIALDAASVGPARPARFAGITHEVMLCELSVPSASA
jgi:transcriptional regulator with XRE-family HTH domain